MATGSGGGVPSSNITLPVRKIDRSGVWAGVVVLGVLVGNGLRVGLGAFPPTPGFVGEGLEGLVCAYVEIASAATAPKKQADLKSMTPLHSIIMPLRVPPFSKVRPRAPES